MNYKNINIKKVFYITCVVVVSCVVASAVIAPLTTESPKPDKIDLQGVQTEVRTYVLTSREDRLRVGIEFDSEQTLRDAINEYCS